VVIRLLSSQEELIFVRRRRALLLIQAKIIEFGVKFIGFC